VDALGLLDPYTLDLVLDEQLTTLQLGYLEVIGRRMVHGLGEFIVESTVLPF
jgi:hypothetical protein